MMVKKKCKWTNYSHTRPQTWNSYFLHCCMTLSWTTIYPTYISLSFASLHFFEPSLQASLEQVNVVPTGARFCPVRFQTFNLEKNCLVSWHWPHLWIITGMMNFFFHEPKVSDISMGYYCLTLSICPRVWVWNRKTCERWVLWHFNQGVVCRCSFDFGFQFICTEQYAHSVFIFIFLFFKVKVWEIFTRTPETKGGYMYKWHLYIYTHVYTYTLMYTNMCIFICTRTEAHGDTSSICTQTLCRIHTCLVVASCLVKQLRTWQG